MTTVSPLTCRGVDIRHIDLSGDDDDDDDDADDADVVVVI